LTLSTGEFGAARASARSFGCRDEVPVQEDRSVATGFTAPVGEAASRVVKRERFQRATVRSARMGARR
jgi:hypothetical protein